MNLLKLKEQGLVALLLFVFTACDKLLPTSGSGELVPVKIRSVSVKGYGEASATRSAGGEKRIVGEPVVQDLGGGMLAEITVEEDVSALRADLETDKTFRVIALKHDDQTYLSHADFTVGGSSNYESPDLHVPQGLECDFICISFNSSATLPTMTASTDIAALTLDASKDLLYQRIKETINGSSSALSFNKLSHQFAKVNLALDGYGKTITSVANNSIKISSVVAPSTFNLTVTANALTGTTPGDVPFTDWVTKSEARRESSLRLLPTSGVPTLSLQAEAIIADGLKSEATEFTLPALEVSKSYTVTLRILKKNSNKFAGSNIYWGGESIGLTFKPYNESNTTPNPETYYQGVLFKWGSLIGISPARTGGSDDFSSGTTASSGQTNGTPIYLKVNGEWKKTNVTYATTQGWFGSGAVAANTTDADAWSPIPSYDGETFSSDLSGDNAYSLLANPDFEHYKGDICNYINPAYRMPTGNELEALYNSNASLYYKGFAYSNITTQAADGKTALTAQYGTFTGISDKTYHLPASGYRSKNSGTFGNVGYLSCYWSGSASSSTDGAYALFLYRDDAESLIPYRNYGVSVRCVLIE